MEKFYSPEYRSAVRKLESFAQRRDRVRDTKPRTGCDITDDEAMAVLDVLTAATPEV
jgi:hypothetical protein